MPHFLRLTPPVYGNNQDPLLEQRRNYRLAIAMFRLIIPPPMETEPSVSHVHSFWNTEACGTHFVEICSDEKDFFEKFREHRYRTEWHIPLLVPFADAKGKRILEIGTGNGADGVMFALNGAVYTGVDLTEAALDATRKHFQLLGLTGTFQKENAEQLDFPDNVFDFRLLAWRAAPHAQHSRRR